MTGPNLKATIVEAVWRVVDRLDYVRSATIAGSFSTGEGIEGIADIDTILIVDPLDAARFAQLEQDLRGELEPVLATAGYRLRINPTLGPLKFNDPQTAVLHLMLYSEAAHREHVVCSPFTCLDWQRSALWRKARLMDVYPVFGLQPHHFLSARRGTKDYLADLTGSVVTYRELQCDATGYQEVRREKSMTDRDRHEFAYHVMRFLMRNFLKLVHRTNEVEDGEGLLAAYFAVFPEGAEPFARLFRELRRQKTTGQFTFETAELTRQVTGFVEAFERQFREAFETHATRHLVCRHAPTELNQPTGEGRIFQGITDVELLPGVPENLDELVRAVEALEPKQVYSSPLRRAVGSLRLVAQRVAGLPAPSLDARLLETNCGACEGLSVGEARRRFPDLFAAWQRREDPCFPDGGENTEAVFQRTWAFVQERFTPRAGSSLTCTHNVVLRCLVGHLLGVPRQDWFRLRIPHLTPVTVLATERFGLFVDLDEDTEREIFAGFLKKGEIEKGRGIEN
ncbi:MAG: histidine phosphatase family protein [Thermoguttaceae bacterium]